jgi:hypothetical protein
MTMDRYGHLFPSPDHQRGMAENQRSLTDMGRMTPRWPLEGRIICLWARNGVANPLLSPTP